VDLLHSTHLQRLLVWPATLGGGAHGIVAVLDHVFDVLALVFACELQTAEQRQLQMVLYNCGFMRKSMRALALVEKLGLAADRPEFCLAPLKLHAILVSESELFARQFVEFGGLQQVKELKLLNLERYVRIHNQRLETHKKLSKASAVVTESNHEADKPGKEVTDKPSDLPSTDPASNAVGAEVSSQEGTVASIEVKAVESTPAGASDAAESSHVSAELNPTEVLLQVRMDMTVHALLLLNQLASQGDSYHKAILAADFSADLYYLLGYPNAIVRSETCRLFGKLCKNSALFYPALVCDLSPYVIESSKSHLPADVDGHRKLVESVTHSHRLNLLERLIGCCQDSDPETRKLACFAVGNAAYHSDYLYEFLASAVPVLVDLLSDREKKTRANAAGALGNLVRNSGILCAALLDAGAHAHLLRLISTDPAIQPQRMALFSLGNLLIYQDCREALVSARQEESETLQDWLEGLEVNASDQVLRSYATRALAKLRAVPRSPKVPDHSIGT